MTGGVCVLDADENNINSTISKDLSDQVNYHVTKLMICKDQSYGYNDIILNMNMNYGR